MERPEEGIIEIHLSHLNKNEHIFIMEFVLNSLKLFPIVAQDFPEARKALERAFELEKKAFQCQIPFDLIEKQKEYSQKRDVAFRYINLALKGAELNSNKQAAEAATAIHSVIKDAGGANIINKSISTKTAIISGIINRIRTDFSDEMALVDRLPNIDLAAALEQLEEMNSIFVDVREGLVKDQSEHIRRELSHARLMTDRAFRALIDLVNIYAYLEKTDVYNPFIAYLNVELSSLRSLLRRKKIPTLANGEDEG